MADPFVAEIRIFPFNFAPRGWAFCDGQILPLSQNTALFSLLGTTYGGNGQTNFGLPDLRGRAPISFGQGAGLANFDQGQVVNLPPCSAGQASQDDSNPGYLTLNWCIAFEGIYPSRP